MVRRALVLPGTLLLAACAVGPDYQRPLAPVPAAWKEQASPAAPAGGEWKPAQPNDDAFRGAWWEIFGDPELNALEQQVSVSNQTLLVAEAQLRAARALARGARSDLLPLVSTNPSISRSSGVKSGSAESGAAPPTVNAYQLPLGLTWEADVFGRIRRGVEAGVSSAQASAADLEAVRLALHAQLAVDYFLLRGIDAEWQLLETTVAGYEKALQLTTSRYRQGIVSGVDVAQAQTQLETTRVQATDLRLSRSQLEHALAILIGNPPADFTLARAPISVEPPEIPLELPSELLERRPDIAAAERRVASANAQVGVAAAGFFPRLLLAASGGYQSSTLAGFFSLPNRFWSLGPTILETLFDAGKRRAASDQARALHDASVAVYRESVLAAFQEVEDNLAALRILADEARQQADAVTAAERLLTLAKNRYQGGITTYLEVVTAQTAALANERAAVALRSRRMTASVNLIKALGGGWRASELPSPATILSRDATPPPARTMARDPAPESAPRVE